MTERKVPLTISPGVIKSQSEYASPGRYIDMDKVRFQEGYPEKIGGWTATGWTTLVAAPRSAIAWRSIDGSKYIAAGSYLKLELYSGDAFETLTNITPVRSSGTLGTDPFETTNTSTTVIVTHTAHGAEQGDFVTFGGAAAVGGITIDGEYQIMEVIDANSYNITHSSAATSSATGGGASVTFAYDINVGELNSTSGGGWGIGPYGEGTYGTERVGGTFLVLTTRWALDTYGEDLLAMPVNNGGLYRWDKSAGGRAALVANAPTGNYMFVTSERVVVVLGAASNPMAIQGSDDEDITDWTPAVTNKSFSRTFQVGTRLVAGTRLSQGVNLIWSDLSCYILQFANNNTTVYNDRIAGAGDDYGLIGSGAFIVVGGVCFWMSGTDFKMFAGSPSRMPMADDIRDFVFDDINTEQAQKICARYDPFNQEVWWHYPSAGSDENDRYVAFSLTEPNWINGTMDRTCFVTQTEQTSVIYGFDFDGDAYQHEVGVDDNGSSMPWYVESGFSDIENGEENVDIFGFIPDFKRQTGDITLTLTSKDYPTDADDLEVYVDTISENSGIIDTRMAGRQIKLRLDGTGAGSDFRLGRCRTIVNAAGNRR